MIVVKVWIEPQEKGKLHHEHQMEVGEVTLTTVEPKQSRLDVLIERIIILLSLRGIIKKLCQEKRDAQLKRIEGQGSVRT
jgi:hypothetical protein